MTATRSFRSWARPFLILALAMLMAPWTPSQSLAQAEPEFFEVPWAQNQWNIGRRLDESELRYCVDPRDPDWELADAIAQTIASGLLLEPQRYVVQSDFVIEDFTRVYAILLEHCDLFMGFKLISGGYPSWVTLSRAYYEARYVYVSANPEVDALSDLPPGSRIGATLGTLAHIRLISYLMTLPADRRWVAYPMGTNDLALSALLAGTVDVALVWAPALWAKQRSDPAYADLHVVDPSPLQPTTLGVGMLMLAEQTFLRASVDEAIAALTEDGTLAAVIEYYAFPATTGD